MIKHIWSNFADKFSGKTSKIMFKVFLINSTITFTTLFSNIVINWLYGKEALGIYSYFFALTFLTSIFAQFGMQNSIPKLIVKKIDPSQLFKQAVIVIIIAAVMFSLSSLFITDYLGMNPNMPYFWLQVLVQITLLTIFSVYSNALRGFKLFISSSMFSFYTRMLFIIAIPLIYLFSDNFQFVFVALSFSLFIMLPFIFKGISRAAKRFLEKEKVTSVSTGLFVKESSIFLLFSLSSFLLMQGDRIVISYFLTFNDVGQYTAYSTFINVIRLGAATFPLVLMPLATERKYKLYPTIKKISIILVPIVITAVLLSYLLTPVLFGADFKLDGKDSFLPVFLGLTAFLMIIYSYFNSLLFGEQEAGGFLFALVIIDVLISSLGFWLLSMLLINQLDLIGVPIALSIAVFIKILLNLFGVIWMRKQNICSS